MSIKGYKDAEGNIRKYDINSLDAPFTAKVGQALVVESVDENGYPNGFGVMNAASEEKVDSLIFNVNFTYDSTEGRFSSDKSFLETLMACASGVTIYGVFSMLVLTLQAVDTKYIIFENIVRNNSTEAILRTITMLSDGSITYSEDTVSLSVDTELSEESENPVQNKVVTAELNAKVNKDDLGGTVEITSGEPTKASTVMTLDPNAEEVNLYTAEEIDAMFGSYATDVANLIGGIES